MTTSEIDNLQLQHILIGTQLTKAKGKVMRVENYQVKRDLEVLIRSAEDIWSKMDNEMIQCRRRVRLTSAYTEFDAQFQKIMKIVEKEIFWQQLH